MTVNVAEMLRNGAEYIRVNGIAQHGGYFKQGKTSRRACAVGACATAADISLEETESLLESKGIDTVALEDFNDSAASAGVVIARMRELADQVTEGTRE